uniref:Uncharacterized protein n=1 Tax=Glossina pallidipes TaxID=7398 RepID=A0A1B0A131_GLOPL
MDFSFFRFFQCVGNSNPSKQEECQSCVTNTENNHVSSGSARDTRHKSSSNRPSTVRQASMSSDDNANGGNKTEKEHLKSPVVLKKISKKQIAENGTVPSEQFRINADHLGCGDQSIRPNESKPIDQTQTNTWERFVEIDRCVVTEAPQMYTKLRNTLTARATEPEASHVEKLHSREGDNCRRGNILYSYLPCSQNPIRKITPINEESEQDLIVDDQSTNHQKSDPVLDCLGTKSCWLNDQAETEIFYTNTVIRRKATNTDRCETMSIPPIMAREEQKISTSHIVVPEKCEASSPPIVAKEKPRKKFKDQEVQTVSWTPLNYSQHKNIFLQSYGIVVSNNDKGNNYSLECMQRNKVHSGKRSKFRHIYWLLRPFRGKYKKPKNSSAIQAIVYKTYFVKWTTPPETLINGFGVRRNGTQTVWSSVLRRCRSAIF